MHYVHLLMHFKVTTRMALNLELVTAAGLLESTFLVEFCNLWSCKEWCMLYPGWVQFDGYWNADHTLTTI